jgi:putative transposase
VWQCRFWEHQIWDEQDFIQHIEYIHYNPSSTGWSQLPGIGSIPAFTAMCGAGYTRRTGAQGR